MMRGPTPTDQVGARPSCGRPEHRGGYLGV